MSHRTVARVVLGYLVIVSLQIGLWALFAPRSFYDDFPGLGRTWVAIDGPYNEHLVRDVGALNLALAVVLVLTFFWPTRELLLVSAGASLTWGIPHLLYHLFNTDGLSTVDAALNVGGLALFAACGLALTRTAFSIPTDEPSDQSVEVRT